jgi:phage tail protein X
MFKKENEIENDFNRYNNNAIGHKGMDTKSSALGKIIQILVILLLLVALAVAGVFGYKYLNKNGVFDNKKDPVESSGNITDTQAIVKNVISKMNTSQENVSLDDVSLIASLVKAEVDKLEESKVKLKDSSNVDSQKKIVKVEKKEKFSSVVISNNSTKDEKLDALSSLSQELDNVLSDESIESSKYTKNISKEVKVRNNEMRVIVVREGDTLSLIAKRAYGNAMAYEKIYDANPSILRNPNKIFIGQKLRVPR